MATLTNHTWRDIPLPGGWVVPCRAALEIEEADARSPSVWPSLAPLIAIGDLHLDPPEPTPLVLAEEAPAPAEEPAPEPAPTLAPETSTPSKGK